LEARRRRRRRRSYFIRGVGAATVPVAGGRASDGERWPGRLVSSAVRSANRTPCRPVRPIVIISSLKSFFIFLF
jgi:hypothetical protein